MTPQRRIFKDSRPAHSHRYIYPYIPLRNPPHPQNSNSSKREPTKDPVPNLPNYHAPPSPSTTTPPPSFRKSHPIKITTSPLLPTRAARMSPNVAANHPYWPCGSCATLNTALSTACLTCQAPNLHCWKCCRCAHPNPTWGARCFDCYHDGCEGCWYSY